MAYNVIPSTWIQVGKSVKKSLFTYIRDNFIDHETRINTIELGINKIEIFNFEVMGFINNYTSSELTQIGTHKASVNTIITEIGVTLMNGSGGAMSSSGGTLSIDIQKSTDNGVTWNTILVAQPSIPDGVSATGSVSGLVVFIPDGEILDQYDMLRVNVSNKKNTQGSFLITVYGDIS